MADAEGALPSTKKRVAGREISRDNPGLDDDEEPEPEMGAFKRASEEVLATRRIVKVRRHQSQPVTSSANPFTGIQLVAQTQSNDVKTGPTAQHQAPTAETQDQEGANQEHMSSHEDSMTENGTKANEASFEDKGKDKDCVADDTSLPSGKDNEAAEDKQETEKEDRQVGKVDEEEIAKEVTGESKELIEETENKNDGAANQDDDQKEKTEASAPVSSFQQLSSCQNAFTGVAGTGFAGSSFSFGLISKEGSTFSAGSLFGQNNENSSNLSAGIGIFNNGSPSLQIFGSAASDASKGAGVSKPSMQEVHVETGEENEKAVFNADAILFEYLDGGWKERGKGELKVNVTTMDSQKARLVMRARGNYRLILNASLYPDMSLKSMEKRGVTFACINSSAEGKDGLVTFALKFKEASILEEFRQAVDTHKGKKDYVLNTPENSPKASDD